jgi:hypothetical protein
MDQQRGVERDPKPRGCTGSIVPSSGAVTARTFQPSAPAVEADAVARRRAPHRQVELHPFKNAVAKAGHQQRADTYHKVWSDLLAIEREPDAGVHPLPAPFTPKFKSTPNQKT